MSRAWFAGLLTVVAAWTGNSVRAEDSPAPPKGPFVVLVGVGQFEDKTIQPRPTAAADARALYKVLNDKKYFDTTPDRVILLTANPQAGERKATRENVVKALHEAVTKTGKDDRIIFAYFGRGATAGDSTCLFTAETNFKERAKTGLLGNDLKPDLHAARDRKLAVLMDVSFKGFEAGKEKLAEPTLRDVLTAVYGGDNDREPAPPNKVVLLATTPSHVPLTKGEHGLFAATVLDALTGAADTEGYEPDGLVTVDELAKYLEKNAADAARSVGKTALEKEAVPFIIGEETSHFILTKNPKVTAKVDARLKALAALEKNGKVSKEVATEGSELLYRMPKLKAPQQLRKEYEALADGTLALDKFAAERARIKEGMKLPAAEADTYVDTILKVIDRVRPDYVKDIPAGQWAAMAVTGLYRRLEQPVPDELNGSLKNAKELTRAQMRDLLRDARVRLGKREDLENHKDADKSILMMFGELKDPYTTYYDQDLIKKMDAPLRGVFSGIGVSIRRDLVRDGLLVVTPIKGSPAYKAGLKAGDLIVEIKRDVDPRGEPLKPDDARVISTRGMKIEKALDVILGKVGVPITIVVERDAADGKTERKEFTIKRGRVAMETVLGLKRDEKDNWTYYADEENKIGYVCLTQFSPNTAYELDTAIRKMQRTGLKGLVLDLRFNPGGLLSEAIKVSDLFLEDGLIVSVRYRRANERHNQEERFYDRGFGAYTGFPVTVLVNGSSASASEIVSAALRDHERATIVGERTYGKGSVQDVIDFAPTSGQIKMTTARYFPPLDENIDKHSTPGKPEDEWGVRPSKGFEVKLSREQQQELAEHFRNREIIPNRLNPGKEAKPFKDVQLEKAVEYIRGKVGATASKSGKKAG
jgi:C-terminal peptidase prc